MKQMIKKSISVTANPYYITPYILCVISNIDKVIVILLVAVT